MAVVILKIIFWSSNAENSAVKSNPFYYYLVRYLAKNIQEKIDTHGNNYLILPLAPVSTDSKFYFQNTPLEFIDHHLTVYQEIHNEIGFNSYSHYTIRFESHTIHIYFQANGDLIKATIENHEQQEMRILNDLLDQDLFHIHVFLEKNVKPYLLDLIDQHTRLLHEHKKNYLSEISEFKNSLFIDSEDISKNSHMVKNLIKKGEGLKLISFQRNFFSTTLSYLQNCQSTLSKLVQLPKAISKKNKLTSLEPMIPIDTTAGPVHVESSSSIKKRSPLKAQHSLLVSEDLIAFEDAYQQYIQAWASLESSNEELALKINYFSSIVQDLLIRLSQNALVLSQQIDSSNPQSQLICRKTDLDVSLFQEKFNQYGLSLLMKCFTSPDLLDQYKDCLKHFVKYLNHTQLEEMIHLHQIPAIKFILDHSDFNLNVLRIRTKSKKRKLSPLCAAYHDNNLELFETLLTYKASALSLYNDMPLAHVLLQLELNNPFYRSFVINDTHAMEGNPRLYNFLCKAIEYKLEKASLSKSEVLSLQNAKTQYELKMGGYIRDAKMSCKTKNNMLNIASHINPMTLESMRSSKRVAELIEELNHKGQELYHIVKKQHIQPKYSKLCNDIYRNITELASDGLEKLMKNTTEADLLDALQRFIDEVDAAIVIAIFHNRQNLSHYEASKFQKAVELLHQSSKFHSHCEDILTMNEKIQSSQASLIKMKNSVEELSEAINHLGLDNDLMEHLEAIKKLSKGLDHFIIQGHHSLKKSASLIAEHPHAELEVTANPESFFSHASDVSSQLNHQLINTNAENVCRK
jgi:hypothetical protein